MKFLLSTLILFITLIGCRDKAQKSEYEWVQLQAPDTVYMNGLVVTEMTTMVKKYKNETLDECIKRMDSTYGTNLFSVHYVNQLVDIEVSGEVIDEKTSKPKIYSTESIMWHNVPYNTSIQGDTTSGLDYASGTGGAGGDPIMVIDVDSDGKNETFRSLDEFLTARDKLPKKQKPIHDTIYIYRDTSIGILQATFYKDGGRVFQMEGLREYNTSLPLPTVTDYNIYVDSISIKILKSKQ